MGGPGTSQVNAAHDPDVAPMNRPPSRGATLLELVVGLALVSVALLISADLIVASARLERGATSQLRNPSVALAGIWLRRDVDNARGLSSSAGTWSVLPFRLVLQDGTEVTYDLSGNTLVRQALTPGASDPTEQHLLRGVVSWRWRVRAARVADFEMRLPNPALGSGTLSVAGPARRQPSTHAEMFTVGRRGLAGGGRW